MNEKSPKKSTESSGKITNQGGQLSENLLEYVRSILQIHDELVAKEKVKNGKQNE